MMLKSAAITAMSETYRRNYVIRKHQDINPVMYYQFCAN
jgi:hypothetical protein